ncbi:MAG: protein-L-isoaspartate(D-aspartate) O-methyltransferase [Salibacteraceae bacterium]
MNDGFREQGLRKILISELREKGIENEDVLEAMMRVPRHLFCFDSVFLHLAYADQAFPIGAGQTISQPYTVAFQTSLLKPKKRLKVLEIGTGSGYQCAVLCEMGMKVYSIERQKSLFDRTSALLERLNYKARCFYGDGYKGKPAFAPYDRILITCGAPRVPQALLDQLKVGGRMVVPVDVEKGVQKMLAIDKVADDQYETSEHGRFQFVPMLEATENRE